MNISFLKAFGAQRKLTRDGQPAKRRGPKPDSKPAQTRRQELNRQAQRLSFSRPPPRRLLTAAAIEPTVNVRNSTSGLWSRRSRD